MTQFEVEKRKGREGTGMIRKGGKNLKEEIEAEKMLHRLRLLRNQ